MICQRCESVEATTRQEFRHAGDHDTWPNHVTIRCDRCAQALREYAALPIISLYIEDERLVDNE